MKPSRFILGLILILAGTVFLLLNLGYGSWSIIRLVPQFWPVLIIIIGLSLLWKGVIPPWFGYSLIIIIIGLVVIVFVMAPEFGIDSTDFDKKDLVKKEILVTKDTYPNLVSAKLDLEFGAGQLLLEPAINKSSWIEGQFNRHDVIIGQNINHEQLELSLRMGNNDYLSMDGENLWNLLISTQLNWEINLKAGALHGDLNLVGIPLRQLTLALGAGDMNLTLGQNGKNSKIKINTGASSIKVKIPEETGVKIKIDGALNNTNLDELHWENWDSTDEYVSPNYETAENKVQIDLDMAISNFEIQIIPAQNNFAGVQTKIEAL